MNIRVRQGDNFWYFSQLFTIPLQLIIDSNPNAIPTSLSVGQIIRIPGFYVNFYTIQQGDTFWGISNQLGLNLNMLELLNSTLDPYALQIGQRINVPVRVKQPIVRGKRRYDYAALMNDINQLIEIYPFIKKNSIGKSVMGKEISELQIGRGTKRVHMNGSFHAHEWITTPILMQTLNEYLLALTNSESIRGLYMSPYYESVLLSIVPMVNPDGVDLVVNGAPGEEPYRSNVLSMNNWNPDFSGWKANIRGVDLNNQFPARWEDEAVRKPSQPGPRDFPGFRPLSEPEAIAIANLTRAGNFNQVIAYHTQGKEIYWGFLGFEPPESETIVKEFARVSGYLAIQYVDSFAGYKDWFIQEWQRPGFTIELGSGVNPLSITKFDQIYQENLGIFLAGLYM